MRAANENARLAGPTRACGCHGTAHCCALQRRSSGVVWVHALHFAAENGHAGSTQVLLAARCDTNVHNDDGRTPLLLAVRSGHHAVAQLLITARQGV